MCLRELPTQELQQPGLAVPDSWNLRESPEAALLRGRQCCVPCGPVHAVGAWVLHADYGEIHLIQGTQFWYPFLNLSSIQ